MGGKTKLLRIKHLKHSQGRVHIHDSGLHVALRIFMSESLSASGGGHRPSDTRPLAGILSGSLYREVELMGLINTGECALRSCFTHQAEGCQHSFGITSNGCGKLM